MGNEKTQKNLTFGDAAQSPVEASEETRRDNDGADKARHNSYPEGGYPPEIGGVV